MDNESQKDVPQPIFKVTHCPRATQPINVIAL